VITCARCGRENADDARFCSSCGNSLVTRVAVQERRVVTALFADLARSTSMGESLDPEVVRDIVGRFFELAAREITAHGGTVEKFSGDAVMAVFGIPSAHEDDPERAVRAAIAIRDGLAAMAAELHAAHGIEVQARIGIESGEVVVGDPFGGATMATGDAMNLAARLEQQAEPGDVVLGAAAWEHVRDMVDSEPLGELALRGHTAAIAGWRVRGVSSEVGRPRGVPGLEAPLTGRDEELALLLDAAGRARREQKAVLFTIFGVPGVGKSRLVRETTSRLAADGWSVVRGRCLPYGDGITYWPVAEIVRSLAAIDADMAPDDALNRLREVTADSDVADRLALALGLRGTTDAAAGAAEGGDREIAFAFRRLIEHLGAKQPVAIVFEDIHWAEPPLLDLIEYLAIWTREAGVLICCPSRPDLLDSRPSWGSGRMEASRISLEPLTEDESRSLLGALLTVEDLPAALRQRILDRAEGNPLFVEEVVRMLIEEGVVEQRGGHWFANQAAANVRVPDNVEALIRARLDTLPAAERVVLQAASVVGRVFQRSAVVALSPAEDSSFPLERHLEDAVLRDLITEERSPDERTFRFRHILIRDVAYNTLPKARRAELHLAVAAWLRAWAGGRMDEFVEIEAYHLEQAVRLRGEVGARIEPAEREAAANALLVSARKALARDDARAVRTFAERGLALEPAAAEIRLELEWLQIDALSRLGEALRAGELAGALEPKAAAAGRVELEGRAIMVRALAIWIDPESADRQRAIDMLQSARDLLAAADDWWYLTMALEYLGYDGWWLGQMDRAETDWQQMRDVARERGLRDREAQASLHLAGVAGYLGEVDLRRRLLTDAHRLAEEGGSRLMLARTERALGGFTAQSDSAERAEPMLQSALAVLEEFGDVEQQYTALAYLGDIKYQRGDLPGALEYNLRALPLVLEHVGYRPEAERHLATVELEMGDLSAAERHAEDAVNVAAKDDWATVASTRSVLGTVRAAQGRKAEAEALLREAAAIFERTEHNGWEEQLNLAEFLLRRARVDEGREWLGRARASAEKYGPSSPFLEFIDRRGREAEAAGGAAS
jgi:class 3 adenylate cyclase/tetratricopeptide (TPR) repeat protein